MLRRVFLSFLFATVQFIGLTTFSKGVVPAQFLPNIVLSWNNPDTSTTMTINFQSHGNIQSPTVRYDSEADVADGQLDLTATAPTVKIEGLDRNYHSVTLRDLKPGQTYYFQVTSTNAKASRKHHFQTLPRESHNITLIQGGDMGSSSSVVSLGKEGLQRGASVILLGGDLAYGNGLTRNWRKWDRWLQQMMQLMEPLNGRLIPMIAALGNHERNSRYRKNLWKKRAPFYYNVFNQGDNPYFYRKLGDSADLYVLDSGFLAEHGGAQANWLRTTMKQRSQVSYRMAMYHAPLYPSHRSPQGPYSKAGRKHWGPIFDQFQLDVSFENHDHTMKRTYPIKANQVDSTGTIYVGDGCWGRDVREVTSNHWYLQKAIEAMHIWHVSIHPDELSLKALDVKGNLLDSFTIPKK